MVSYIDDYGAIQNSMKDKLEQCTSKLELIQINTTMKKNLKNISFWKQLEISITQNLQLKNTS